MSTPDIPPAPSSTSEQTEAWLQQVVRQRKRSREQIAHAMQQDGFPAQLAQLYAAVALLRYSELPVLDLLEDPSTRAALGCCRTYLGGALDELLETRVVEPTAPALDPRELDGNETRLDGVTVSLALVCRHPRIAHFRDVMTEGECAALVAEAAPRLRDSETINYDTGARSVEPSRRSSRTAYLAVDESSMSRAVTERVARLIRMPLTHCEDLVVTHYAAGAGFAEHVDYFEDQGKTHLGKDGQRIATVILYLSEVEAGGATTFPTLGLEICPQRGSALYFSYRMADGSLDPASAHAGAPVVRGEKWIATLWFHELPCSR